MPETVRSPLAEPGQLHPLPGRKTRPKYKIEVMKAELGSQIAVAVYVVAMAAVIVGVDFAFFRNRVWERLTVNIGIVLVFAAFYLRFLRRP